MLTDYYKPLSIYRTVASATPGQTPTEITIGFYKGFIQPVSSSETFMQGKSAEVATHRLYTYMKTPIVKGDRVNQNSQNYRVISSVIQPGGISGVDHHKEILLGLVK